MDNIAAWIINDRCDLEFEVMVRQKFSFYAKHEISHLLAKKTELNYYLELADGHIRSLEGELDILYEEASEF